MNGTVAAGALMLGLVVGSGWAQVVPNAPQGQGKPAAAPLKLYSLNSDTQADPFPAVNPKFFTADSPTVATVESYLKSMLGYDSNRIWRVMGIQKTAATGVAKVTAMVSERGPNAKTLTAVFFVLPDGKHMLSGDGGVASFGAQPFAEARAILQAKADGPAKGPAAKDLMLVEFSDLQCPHCKDAQATMSKLEQDFPKARIVYQSYPLVDIHPYAFLAAAYGACIALKNPEAYFTYAQAVYDTQGGLLPDSGTATLNNAATKAGMDPAAIATCAATDAIKAKVNASIDLGNEVGVDQTPMLSVNGRLLSIAAVSYETLKSLIVYQATMDGVAAAAASPSGDRVDLKAH